jgi:2-aminomuconate deaminase
MDKKIINSAIAPPNPLVLIRMHGRWATCFFFPGLGRAKRDQRIFQGVTLDENKKILSYNIEEQCHAVFQNVKFVLEASGSSWDKLIDITVYLTNMKDDFAVFNKIYASYFPDKATQPCRTTVEVNALPTPIAIELKCIAVVTS